MIQHHNHTILVYRLPLWAACLCGWLLWGSCSSEDEVLSSVSPTDGVTVEVELSTRVQNANDDLVTYPDDNLVGTQHATTVMIYFFKGTDESAEYCGSYENIGWKEHFEAIGDTKPHTKSMTYRLTHKLEKDIPYQFLAVGTNDEGTAAFEFPFTTRTTLAEAIGQLKEKSAEAIRRSEIYIGTAVYEPQKHSATHITLHRRVAGVAGWFTNVPKQVLTPVTEGVQDKLVASLRLSLYAPQNTKLPLLIRQQKPNFEDYIASAATESDAARTTLVEIQMPAEFTVETKVNGGSFVLPIPAPADRENHTLRLELVNQSGQVLSIRRIKLPKNDDLDHGETGGGTGIIDTESAFRFPIIANHYYGIGSPQKPIDLKGSGTDLTITVDPSWDEEADLELGEKNE